MNTLRLEILRGTPQEEELVALSTALQLMLVQRQKVAAGKVAPAPSRWQAAGRRESLRTESGPELRQCSSYRGLWQS